MEDVTPLPSRRRFLKAGVATGAALAYFGAADRILRDTRWDENESCWLETARRDAYPPLKGTATVDVAIIGGGLTGLSAAYHIKKADPALRVAVVEARYPGFGASGRNGGLLCPAPESGEPLEEMGNLVGYTGSGVTMAIRAGDFLRSLVAGEQVPAWCTRSSWRLPGEPFRYLGVIQ